MKDYTYQDMLKMQEDAAYRVREMKKRATIVMDENEQIPDFQQKEMKKGVLDILLQDSDAMLVISLIMLMTAEKNDYLTNFALMYILL